MIQQLSRVSNPSPSYLWCGVQTLAEVDELTIELLVPGLATAHVMRILRVYVDVTHDPRIHFAVSLNPSPAGQNDL